MKKLASICIATAISLCSYAQKDTSCYSVYYLVVGNSDYEQDRGKFKSVKFKPFDNIPEAGISAHIVESILKQHSNAKGINISSSPKRFVTLDTLNKSLLFIRNLIKKDKPVNPLFLFYYCGHAISGVKYNEPYLIPGNFTYSVTFDNSDELSGLGYVRASSVANNVFHVRYFIDALKKDSLPFCVLLDCCRKEDKLEAEIKKFKNSVTEMHSTEAIRFSPSTNSMSMTSDVELVQEEMEYRRKEDARKKYNKYFGSDPVALSCPYNEFAVLVDIPNTKFQKQLKLDADLQVGPICRNLLTIIEDQQSNLTLGSFLQALTSNITNGTISKVSSGYVMDTLDTRLMFRKQ